MDKKERRSKSSRKRKSERSRRHSHKNSSRNSSRSHNVIDGIYEIEGRCAEMVRGEYDDLQVGDVDGLLARDREFSQTRMLARLTTDIYRLLLTLEHENNKYAKDAAFHIFKDNSIDRPLSQAATDMGQENFLQRIEKIGEQLKQLMKRCYKSFAEDVNNNPFRQSLFDALDVDLPVLCFNYEAIASKRPADIQKSTSLKKKGTGSTTTIKSGDVINKTSSTSSSIPLKTRPVSVEKLIHIFRDYELQLSDKSEYKANNDFEKNMLQQSSNLTEARDEKETQTEFVSMLRACFVAVRQLVRFNVSEFNGKDGQGQDFCINGEKNNVLVCGEVKTSIGDNIADLFCDHDKCPYVKWSGKFHDEFVQQMTQKNKNKNEVLTKIMAYIKKYEKAISRTSVQVEEHLRDMSTKKNGDYQKLEEAIESDLEQSKKDNEPVTIKLDKWLQNVFTRPCKIERDGRSRMNDRHSSKSLTSQVFGYMVSNNVHFAIVTDYDRTAFCISDSQGTMFISESISNWTKKFYSVPQAIVMFCMLANACKGDDGVQNFKNLIIVLSDDKAGSDAVFDGYNLPPSCNNIPENGAPIKDGIGYTQATDSTNLSTSVKSIQFGDSVGYGRTGDAHMAEYDGEKGVLKMVDKLENPSMQDEISWEAYVYKHLKDLQGFVVPKVLRAGMFKEWYIDGLLTSYMGETLATIQEKCENDINRDVLLKKAKEALEKVHSHGFLHGDIKPQNIVLDGQMNPIFIDFGNARRLSKSGHDATSEKQNEMKQLEQSFSFHNHR